MPNKSKKQNITYTYKEVLQSIEDGINLWDFAIKFNISNLEKSYVKKLLLLCTNNDETKANSFSEILYSNSKNYVKDNINPNEELNYNTILFLAKNGCSRIEIMKKFGKTSYASFGNTLKNIFAKEKISKEMQSRLDKLLRRNIKTSKVSFVAETLEKNRKSSSSTTQKTSSEVQTLPETVKEINMSPTSKNNVTTNDSNSKIILYTVEYLAKQVDILDTVFDEVNQDEKNEHIILSCTLSNFMDKNTISSTSKMKLTESLNNEKVRILMANSSYQLSNKKHVDISVENEIVLSQALMLSSYTTKKIYIATCDPKTALNAMSLNFGVRVPKNRLLKKFSNITDENLKNISDFFDFELEYNDVVSNSYKGNSAIILDTCVIINNANETHREKILSDTSQQKILTRIVLDELRECKIFFSTLFAVKCNPTIVIDLYTHLVYNYNDMAILNYAMRYRRITGKEVIILTHDWQFSVEALKYNVKTKYFPSTYMSTFEIEEIKNDEKIKIDNDSDNLIPNSFENDIKDDQTEYFSESDIENLDDSQNTIYHQTVSIQKVSSKPVIMNSPKIQCVKSAKTMENIVLKGHKAYKYYPVELGDFVCFKNDPNLYKLVSISGKNNLESVDPYEAVTA